MTDLTAYIASHEQAKEELAVLKEQLQVLYQKEEDLEDLIHTLQAKIGRAQHGLEPGTVVLGPGGHKYSVLEIVFSDDFTAKPSLWGLQIDDRGRTTNARRNLQTRWKKVS